MRHALTCVGVIWSLSIAFAARPLAEVEAKGRGAVVLPAADVYANKDLIDVPVTAESMEPAGADEVIDKSKFDKVYETGKAVDGARLTSLAGVTRRRFQLLLLEFKTEVSIVTDKATTKAEKSLALDYSLAYLQYQLGAALLTRPGLGSLDAMDKAAATLESANRIYLPAASCRSTAESLSMPRARAASRIRSR